MRLWMGILGMWMWTGSLAAAPPTVATMSPRGLQRGQTVEITFTGTDFTEKTQLALPFPATVKPVPLPKANPAQAKFLVTVEPSVPLGIYPIRVFTEAGISPPLFAGVDGFPSVVEIEDNNTPEKAQKVPNPVVVTGLCTGGDVDYFRFPAKKGQTIVVETEAARIGAGILPQIRVTDGKGRFLAGDDSQKVRGDARLHFIAPADGEYVVEFSDSRYRGAAPPQYRLKIGEYDYADEVFPLVVKPGSQTLRLYGGTLGAEKTVPVSIPQPGPGWPFGPLRWTNPASLKAGSVGPEVLVSHQPDELQENLAGKTLLAETTLRIQGRLRQPGELHRFSIQVKEGEKWRILVEAQVLGSWLDGELKVLDTGGKVIAQADDTDVVGQQGIKSADPALEFTVPAGIQQLTVQLRDALHRGGVNFGYRLRVEPAGEDFLVQLPATEVNVPQGGVQAVPITVQRRGYAGPIQVRISNLPASIQAEGGYIPESGTAGFLTLKHREGSPRDLAPLLIELEGKALAGPPVTVAAVQHLYLSKDGNVPGSLRRLSSLALALTSPDPFTLQGPEKVELIHGFSREVPIQVGWVGKPAGPVEITALGAAPPAKPAPGLIVVKPGTGPGPVPVGLTAPAALPEGRAMDFIPQAKVKINNKDVLVVGPAIPVWIHRPFQVQMEPSQLALVPGQKVKLRGTIERRAPFQEAISLKLEGLPKGILATLPKTVDANQTSFEAEIQVDAKTPPGKGSATLNLSAMIQGTSYSSPALSIPWFLDKK